MTILEKLSYFIIATSYDQLKLTTFHLIAEAKAEIERLEKEVAARYSDSELEAACSAETASQVRKLILMRRQNIDKEKVAL